MCCFLSGGLDSSIISKVAANYYERNGRGKLSTYSVDYVDNLKYFKKSVFQPNSDEEYIKIMLDDIKSSHNYVVLDNESLVQALNEATIARDLPGMADIDSSLLLFCREIKKKFTVALSGECSDEIFAGYPWYHNKEILFDDTFPWSHSLNIRKKILRKDFLKNADEYVRQRYLDTVAQTDKLPRESKLNSRMREMFMLNVKWFMQTLLDDKNTKENNLFRLAIQVSKIKLYKIKVSTETCLLLFLYLNFIISKIKNKKMKGDIIVSTYNFFCKVS